jgi:hypothetical protein
VGWLLGSLRHNQNGRGNYPVLAVQGEEGTGKSTFSRVLRAFIDPSTVALRKTPKDGRDLFITAKASHLVCLDNLSGLSPDIADDICRLATGGGFDTRRLFSDDEQTLIDVQKPVVMNGIDDICTRPDLTSRSIILHLPVIDRQHIREIGRFWADFDAAQGRIFAGILDALSCAIRNKGKTGIATGTRLADFAEWVTGAEPALGWPSGTFLERYKEMRDRVTEDNIDASAVGSTLAEYMASIAPVNDWSPTPTHLYDTLTNLAGIKAKAKGWPQSPRGMGNALTRLAPSLRAVGISFTKEHTHDRRYKFVKVAKKAPEAPEAHSETHNSNDNNELGSGGAGRIDGRMGASGRNGAHRSAPPKEAHSDAHIENINKINDKGVSGASGASFTDCTPMTAKEFTGSRRGLI